MEYAIRLKGLTKSFQKEKVLKNITHDFEKGKIHGIMGFNGSGKTVMFKCICGFLQPESGTVLVGGKQIGKELDFPDSVGIIIENPGFFLDLSGFANLKRLASLKHRISDDDVRATMRALGLDPLSKKKVGQYSLGMRERLGIAQAIMEDPELLILDEPFNGLDNIKTYPAAYPGVFGVRQDRYGLLGNGQILFQEQKGYNIENSIIANFSWNGIVNQANSYAAPVVTGHIATYLNRKPTAGFDDVMDFLMTIATHKSDYPDILENVIRDKTNIEIPVIAGIDLDYEEMIQLKVMFSQNGYYAINLQKNPLDENVIPLEYYDDSNESLNDILYTVYIAYEPDIILLNQEEEIFESSKASDIDMYIVRKNNMYELYAEDRIGITYNIEDIYELVCQYFA